MAPSVPPHEVLAALCGFPVAATRQLIGAVVSTSDEAEDLLDAMPRTVRALSVATAVSARRCYGEIRGPVMWSETMAARSASAGDPGLFVCALPQRAYDTLENRVLVAALSAVRSAAHDAEHSVETGNDLGLVRRARRNGTEAMRWLDHRALIEVPREKPSGRAVRRARAGSRRQVYRPALDLLERARRPVGAGHVLLYADRRALADHRLLADVLTALEDRGVQCGQLFAEHGRLACGPVRYHRARVGRRPADDGVTVGDVIIDSPDVDGATAATRAAADLAARAGGRPHVLVTGAGDIDRALAMARLEPTTADHRGRR